MRLASGPAARSALATYGIRGERLASVVWAAVGAIEAGLGVCVAIGAERAIWATSLLFIVFAGAQAGALVAGRAGAPCGCFGANGTVGRASVARAALLAVALRCCRCSRRATHHRGVARARARRRPGGHRRAGDGLLALAREIGELRMSIAPQGALEIPSRARRSAGAPRSRSTSRGDPTNISLAVFTSDGCHICHALAPAIDAFERDPRVVLRRFDEVEDANVWALADVPGSPFAVAVGADGIVLAKGTFNSGPARVGARGRRAPPYALRGSRTVSRDELRGRPRRGGLAASTSRRGFLSRVGAGVMALAGAKTAAQLIKPGEAEAYHFCGHIYTTDSCPHPTGLPRIDSRGYPLRARDGKRVDDLGRLVDKRATRSTRTASSSPTPTAARSPRHPHPICTGDRRERTASGARPTAPGTAAAAGDVRKLVDCCALHAPPHQRRRGADGLLLQGPEGVLRHVLPDEGARADARGGAARRGAGRGARPAPGRRAGSRWSTRWRRTAMPGGCARRWSPGATFAARAGRAGSRRSADWRCSGRRSAPARRRSPWPPRSRSRPPPARRAGRGSSRRSACRCRNRGAACCRCRWPPGSTGSARSTAT